MASRLSSDALASCVLPCCWRTESDVRAGFCEDEWLIEACEFHETKDPVRKELETGKMNPLAYGRATIDSFKAVCHPTFIRSLVKVMPRDKAEQVLGEAYGASIETIAADPEQYNLDVSFWYVVARKKQ